MYIQEPLQDLPVADFPQFLTTDICGWSMFEHCSDSLCVMAPCKLSCYYCCYKLQRYQFKLKLCDFMRRLTYLSRGHLEWRSSTGMSHFSAYVKAMQLSRIPARWNLQWTRWHAYRL